MVRIDGREEGLEGLALPELREGVERFESDVVAGMISDEVGEGGREFRVREGGGGVDGGDERSLLVASQGVGDEGTAGVIADAAKIFEDLRMLIRGGVLELVEECARVVGVVWRWICASQVCVGFDGERG